jgi:hypothetical protein
MRSVLPGCCSSCWVVCPQFHAFNVSQSINECYVALVARRTQCLQLLLCHTIQLFRSFEHIAFAFARHNTGRCQNRCAPQHRRFVCCTTCVVTVVIACIATRAGDCLTWKSYSAISYQPSKHEQRHAHTNCTTHLCVVCNTQPSSYEPKRLVSTLNSATIEPCVVVGHTT